MNLLYRTLDIALSDLVDLPLLSRHFLHRLLGQLLFLLLCVLLGDVGKGVVTLVTATLIIVPFTVKLLKKKKE